MVLSLLKHRNLIMECMRGSMPRCQQVTHKEQVRKSNEPIWLGNDHTAEGEQDLHPRPSLLVFSS